MLSQTAFVRALERWHRVSEMESPFACVYTTALNVRRSNLRRAARGARRLFEGTEPEDPQNIALRRAEVAAMLARLPRGQQDVLLLDWMGYTSEEIGRLLGIASVSVRVKIHPARRTVQQVAETQPDE